VGSEYFLKDNALKYTDPTFVFPTLAPTVCTYLPYRKTIPYMS